MDAAARRIQNAARKKAVRKEREAPPHTEPEDCNEPSEVRAS